MSSKPMDIIKPDNVLHAIPLEKTYWRFTPDWQLQPKLKMSGHQLCEVGGGKTRYATAFSVHLSLPLREVPSSVSVDY